MTVEKKRRAEMKTLAKMVRIYCRGHRHAGAQGKLCGGCAVLLEYALARTGRCPRMAEKTFCSRCPAPCYGPEMAAQIKTVMKFSGPRMLFHSPVLALRHLLAMAKTA
ncbi:MAG: nitrous oxide-stimulated promoter family protein [Oscillospiraceae bacterium]